VKAEERLALQYLEQYPEKVSRLLSGFPLDKMSQYVSRLSPENLANLLHSFSPFRVAHCLKTVDPKIILAAFEKAKPEEVANWLLLVSEKSKQQLLSAVSSNHQVRIKSFLKRSKDTAIFYIDTKGLTFYPHTLVKDLFKKIKASKEEVLSYLYITSEDQTLLGVVAVTEIIKADPNKRLDELMKSPVISLVSSASKREILSHPAWSDFHAIPVVDSENHFLGCLRYGKFKRLEKEEQYSRESLFNISISLFEVMITIALELMDSVLFSKQKAKT
jgi:magnesium transporter